MTSANSDIHCQLTSSLVAVTREYIFGTWIFARLLTQADVRVLKSAWIVALEFGCSWDWRRDHCIMHTGRCGQAPFLFIWSCRRKVVETRKSRIRAYPWIVVWSCSCSTPHYSANRSIRKQHQKTSLDRGKLSRFFSGTIWARPCNQKLFLVLLGLAWWQELLSVWSCLGHVWSWVFSCVALPCFCLLLLCRTRENSILFGRETKVGIKNDKNMCKHRTKNHQVWGRFGTHCEVFELGPLQTTYMPDPLL